MSFAPFPKPTAPNNRQNSEYIHQTIRVSRDPQNQTVNFSKRLYVFLVGPDKHLAWAASMLFALRIGRFPLIWTQKFGDSRSFGVESRQIAAWICQMVCGFLKLLGLKGSPEDTQHFEYPHAPV